MDASKGLTIFPACSVARLLQRFPCSLQFGFFGGGQDYWVCNPKQGPHFSFQSSLSCAVSSSLTSTIVHLEEFMNFELEYLWTNASYFGFKVQRCSARIAPTSAFISFTYMQMIYFPRHLVLALLSVRYQIQNFQFVKSYIYIWCEEVDVFNK